MVREALVATGDLADGIPGAGRRSRETFQTYTEKDAVEEKFDQEVMMETKERQVVEGEERGDAVLERVLLQREKHRGRSIFVRAGVVVVGGAISVFAAPLSVISPELGLPLLLFGLRLLALEFDWAARLYVRVEKLARRVLGGLKRLFKSKRGIALFAVVVVASVAVAALVL